MKKSIIAILLIIIIFTSGCGTDELENQAFPLAMGVEASADGTFQVYLACPDLQDSDAQENALSADLMWQDSAADLFAAVDIMSANNSKNIDLNHLKVLILDRKVLESGTGKEQVISFFQENREAAWNTVVMIADEEVGELFSGTADMGSSLGVYLEDLLEEWQNVRDGAKMTVKDLVSQYYNQNETTLAPLVGIQDGQPEIRGFAVLRDASCAGELSLKEGWEALLLQNQLKQYTTTLADGTRVSLSRVSVARKIAASDEGTPVLYLTLDAAARIENRLLLSKEEEQALCRRAQEELTESLIALSEQQRTKAHIDVTDSFLLLAGADRSLWQRYGTDQEDYEEALQYEIQVNLTCASR